jgi:predicted negative regulator of RcsB-dependent stress response
MADDYLSDREQEEALRLWWRENWPWIIGGIVLGLALLAGWQYWKTHRAQQAEQAFELYREYQNAGEDPNKAVSAFDRLNAEYATSPYTMQARLLQAKKHVDAAEYDEAVQHLQAVIDRAQDAELVHIARLRLSRVFIQQGKYDEAVGLLNPDTAGAFAAQMREIRGDALFERGDRDAARAEYAAALAANADAQVDRSMLEMKLQQTGGELPAAGFQGQP